MIKFFNKIILWIKKINKILKEIDTLDRVYYKGKLYSAVIFTLSLLVIACFILAFIVFK